MSDYIDRQAAIDAILAIKDYGNSDRANALGLAECAVTTLPSVQPDGWLARHRDEILKAGMEGREFEFRIGGRLFAIREKTQ